MEEFKDKIIREQAARIAELELEIVKLKRVIEELQRRLGLNSSNSSKPPSSDGLRKQTINRREASDKLFGGQLGHEGGTLGHVTDPDEVRDYYPMRCAGCNSSLTDASIIATEERQEYDIVVRRHVIAHRVHTKQCTHCRGKTSTIFPAHIKSHAQYSNQVRALGVYLGQHFISQDRIQTIMRDLFGLSISDTTLMAYAARCAEKLASFMTLVAKKVIEAPVKNADETGIRIAGRTTWLHTLSTELFTHYRIGTRGDMPNNLTGIIVHDHWKSYLKLTGASHAFCNAHHIRELVAVHELDLESWAGAMKQLLITASKLENPTIEQITQIEHQYDAIIAEGIVYHQELGPPHSQRRKKRVGHNLLLRLQKFKAETLRFLRNRDVPFTNNLAERDLRMIKLHQKVSGCFRTAHGAEHFIAIRSFVSTLNKHGLPVLHALSTVISEGFSPALLPTLTR